MALNNQEVRKEIINYLGKNLQLCERFYKEYRTPFPLISQDGMPISMHLMIFMPLLNHINDKYKAVPNHIKDWITFEDYIFNMILDIIEKPDT
jgi:hypothetical protein